MPPRPTHHAPALQRPSLLARALRSMLMALVTALSWALALALGVAGLILSSVVDNPWRKLLALLSLIAVSFALPFATVAGARRLLYGPSRNR